MIVEIHKSSPSMSGTLQYNESKVLGGVASVIFEHGIGSTGLTEIYRMFEERERMSLREAQHLSFQMSVNPGPDDTIGEDRIPAFVAELMEGLGYGDQPWVVFRHEDTGRIHYHVVSTRVDADGRKIRDFYEKRACDRIVLSLEGKYGFVKGGAPKAVEATEADFPVFRPGEGDVVGMIRACVKHSLSYRFTTGKQFAEVLRCHGVIVQEGLGKKDLKAHLSFQGLGQNGRPCTASVSGAKMGFDVREALRSRTEYGIGTDVSREKSALRNDLSEALDKCGDLPSLVRELKGRGIDIAIYRDREGTPRGATLIDHRNACVFKGSEVSRPLGTALLNLVAREKAADEEAETMVTEAKETTSFNSGVSEALAMMLDVAMTAGSGREGKSLEDPDLKKKKKRKR